MIRSFILLVVVALVVASCGYTRSEAVQLPGEPSNDGQNLPIDPATGLAVTPQSGPPPTALAPPIEVPMRGGRDDVATTINFDDGGSVQITFGEIDDVVRPSLENAQYRTVFGASPELDVETLNTLILNEFMEAEIASLGIEISEADQIETKETLTADVSGFLSQEVGDPDGNRDELAEQLFEEIPFLALFLELQTKRHALVSYLEANATIGEVPCVSHILLPNEELAAIAVAELNDGDDFAELALRRSCDESTSETGGFLGCVPPENFVDPAIVQAVEVAEVGQISDPVESEAGWHVLLVTELKVEDIEPSAWAEREFGQLIGSRAKAAELEVNPAIGSWDPAGTQVVPPPS